MPRWLVAAALVVSVAATLASVALAVSTGAWELFSHAALGVFGSVLLALLLWRSGDQLPPAQGRPRLRAAAAVGCALGALGIALAYEWSLGSVWTPPVLLVVIWLGVLAIVLGARLTRNRS